MSNESLLQQYRNLSDELQKARKANGGHLSEEAEEVFLGKMDTLWWLCP